MTTGTGAPPRLDHLVGIPLRRLDQTPAADLLGTSPAGERVRLAVTGVEGMSLLLFLASHCDGCTPLWEGWARPELFETAGMPSLARVLAVVPEGDDGPITSWLGDATSAPGATGAGDRWGPRGSRLVRSDAAWSFYKVFGPPFFTLVDGPTGLIVTEGVAWAVPQVAGEVARALIGRDAVPGQPSVGRK